MRRRDFITLLGGAATAWPLAARAQQRERMRRIGVLMHLAADDPEGQRRVAAFLQGLQEAGWAVDRNVDIDIRWAAGEALGLFVGLSPPGLIFPAISERVGGKVIRRSLHECIALAVSTRPLQRRARNSGKTRERDGS
jgi:hypothetical protein